MLTPARPERRSSRSSRSATRVGGYLFESIPDGISLRAPGNGTVDILVNHETSLVPFPAADQRLHERVAERADPAPEDAQACSRRVRDPDERNYQRFCSNFLVGQEHGFDRELLLTNEEAGHRLRQGLVAPAGPSAGEAGAEQAGVVVAYDIKSGEYRTIYGMGRHNHENSVGVAGLRHPVVLSGDDTFDAPAQSQLYSYRRRAAPRLERRGRAVRVRLRQPGGQRLRRSVDGVAVGHRALHRGPRAIATGKINGREVTSADFGYPTPARPGVRRRRRCPTGRSGCSSTGASSTTSSSSSGSRTSPTTGREWKTSSTSPTPGRGATSERPRLPAARERSYRTAALEDRARPERPARKVRRSRSSVEGDDRPAQDPASSAPARQPRVDENAIFFQEDPGSHSARPPTDPARRTRGSGATTSRRTRNLDQSSTRSTSR